VGHHPGYCRDLARRLVLLLLALGLVAAAPARAQTSASDQRTITVIGSGSVTAANDTALLSLGVSTTRSTASKALAATSARTRRVLAALAAQGIAAEDIQTQAAGLRRSVQRATKHRKRKVVYIASNSVSVTVRSVSKTGAVISAAVKAGATHVGEIEFFPSNERDLYRQSLVLAYDDAREKAALLAERAGVTLGRPLSIFEGSDNFEPLASEAPGGATPAPIEPGTSDIGAFVTVVFAIS
jgi:uncharacterized protein